MNTLHCAYLILYVCRFKKVDKERLEYTQPMETLMPIMLERMKGLLQVDTEDSLRLQHRILKVFMCSIQVNIYLHTYVHV